MKRDSSALLRGNTPTLILAVLERSPNHGYGIAREIERRSESGLALREGSLYPALRGLEADGLVTSHWETLESGPSRRVYTITHEGRAELARRTRSWRTFVQAIDQVLGGSPDVQPG
jgi:PadR family transcriptional regulator PadR